MLELPQRELTRWERYWGEEPWGSVRDNMHAAMIVCELLKPHLAKDAQVSMSSFMFETRLERIERIERDRLAASMKLAALARSTARRKARG